jgi:hypothetical protein
MIDIAQKLRQRSAGYKYMGLRCLMTIIEFRQMFIQGLWVGFESLQQLRFFNEDNLARVQRKIKRLPTVGELIHAGEEDNNAKVFFILQSSILFSPKKKSQKFKTN